MTEINEFGLPTTGTATRPPRRLPTLAPMRLRIPAFLVDVAVHLAIAFAAYTGTSRALGEPGLDVGVAFLAYVGASLVQREILQRYWHATLGKRLFGLTVVRTYSDRPLTLWYLTKWWVLGIFVFFWTEGDFATAKEDGFPSTVRRTRA